MGDSLTEGIGTRRISYVSEFVRLLRGSADRPVHAVRMRSIDFSRSRDLKHFDFAGHCDWDSGKTGYPMLIVNLAAEGTTIEDDATRLSAVLAMQPSRVFLLRGPLETIVRPAAVTTGRWPFWVPHAWRSCAAMDPRCYFSSARLRRAKQVLIDRAKQRVRQRLLARGGAPLLDTERYVNCFRRILEALREQCVETTVLTLPPVSEQTFPGTSALVEGRNQALRDLCRVTGAHFADWVPDLRAATSGMFCRDGFHPSEEGAKLLAQRLAGYLSQATHPPVEARLHAG
jgi:lysophospholipase L1-like esterase